MKRIIAIILVAIALLGCTFVYAQAEEYSLEECVAKMKGYKLQQDIMAGTFMLICGEDAYDYYRVDGYGLLPLFNGDNDKGIEMNALTVLTPSDVTEISEMIVLTDTTRYFIKPTEAWTCAGAGFAFYASTDLLPMFQDIGTSSSVMVRFIQTANKYVDIEITMETRQVFAKINYIRNNIFKESTFNAIAAQLINAQTYYSVLKSDR